MKILPYSYHCKMGQGNSHDGYLVGHSGAMPNSETLLQNHKPISSHTNKENAH